MRIEDVFDATWRVVGSRNTPLAPREEWQLRLLLAKLLVELESSGVTDPRELRRRAIEEIVLAAPGRDSAFTRRRDA
jgi:hypothetical protein